VAAAAAREKKQRAAKQQASKLSSEQAKAKQEAKCRSTALPAPRCPPPQAAHRQAAQRDSSQQPATTNQPPPPPPPPPPCVPPQPATRYFHPLQIFFVTTQRTPLNAHNAAPLPPARAREKRSTRDWRLPGCNAGCRFYGSLVQRAHGARPPARPPAHPRPPTRPAPPRPAPLFRRPPSLPSARPHATACAAALGWLVSRSVGPWSSKAKQSKTRQTDRQRAGRQADRLWLPACERPSSLVSCHLIRDSILAFLLVSKHINATTKTLPGPVTRTGPVPCLDGCCNENARPPA